MMSRWRWLALQLTRRLWARAFLFSALAVVSALAALGIGPLLPDPLPGWVVSGGVDRILDILASSMLAVTAFSVGAMVNAHGIATANLTPRATKLLLEDPSTQNALGAFLGSFLYALVGLIGLEAGVYTEPGKVVLFLVTILVIISVVLTLLRWIDYLSRLGRLEESTAKVEEATAAALANRARAPCLGGQCLGNPERDIPTGAEDLTASASGYVQFVDMAGLQQEAESRDGTVYLLAPPGTYVLDGAPLARVHGFALDDEATDALRTRLTLGPERSFDQDPRFGLAVLGEIAARALSPGVNDPGTAIDVISRAARLLAGWHAQGQESEAGSEENCACARVYVPPLRAESLVGDVFHTIARDGAGLVEVQVRLQKTLAALAALEDGPFVEAARHQSAAALERAEQVMTLEADRKAVRGVAGRV